MEYPLVSIIITCYNRVESIGKAIESALSQDYENIEVIITDNCSTDGSDEVIKKYCVDKRVIYSRNETNIGMAANFKKGIHELASGKYFVNLCSDDFLINNSFVSQAVALTNKYENISLVKGRYKMIDEKIDIINNSNFSFKKEFYYGQEWFEYSFSQPFSDVYEVLNWAAVFINREMFIRIDIFKYQSQYVDVFCGIKLLLNGNIAFIDKPSYIFRTLANRAEYAKTSTREAYLAIFNLVDIFSKEDKEIYSSILESFYNRFYDYIINYFMQFIYRYSKKDFKVFVEHLTKNYPSFLSTIRTSKKWKLYSILYYNKKIGMYLSIVKNSISRKPIIS